MSQAKNEKGSESKYSRQKRNTFLYLKKKLNYQTPKEVQERLKEQAKIVNAIKKALRGGPKTVPEIAKETGLDTYTVFWYIATMLRYMEVDMVEKNEEDYWIYKLKSQ
ncbi:MAG: hypothetical protein ACP6IP_04710 [Candidatus Njordarchaeia archaeon]